MLLPVGTEAPPFSLPDLDGRDTALVNLLALGPVWLIFYKQSCPTCRLALPFLRRLFDAVPGLDGSVVLIAQDTPQDAAEYIAELGHPGPVLIDPEPWSVSAAYGLRAVPSHVFIEMSGVIAAAGEGFDRAAWESLAQNLATRSGAPEFRLFRDTDDIPALRPG